MTDSTRSLGPSLANSWQVRPGAVDLRRPPCQPAPVELPALPERLTLDLARAALLVVDMQNDFCHPDGWLAGIGVDVTPARAPIPVLAALTARLRPRGVPIIWLNWGNRPDRANLPPNVLHVYDPAAQGRGIGSPLPGNGAPVLQAGSWAAAVVDELSPAEADIRVDKYRMSGFFDTPLDSVLRGLRVDTVLFAGVNADQCVLATLTDAACLGYDAVLVEDAVATTSPDYCMAATLYNVRQCFGFTVTSADLLAALPPGG
ncbi:MAG TPA: isochorismatase family cysteine hydrolase [Pseudonocardia sp.]|jgi:nicotinamidase-related amidase|uniref:cysteine hydrolase family protein n=1 Tax=Pseudonocardia sp. TaxID=60912 RepID=UPI002EDBACE7